MVTILNKYVLCGECRQTWVKKTYARYKNKPLCEECRGWQRTAKQSKKKGGARR